MAIYIHILGVPIHQLPQGRREVHQELQHPRLGVPPHQHPPEPTQQCSTTHQQLGVHQVLQKPQQVHHAATTKILIDQILDEILRDVETIHEMESNQC